MFARRLAAGLVIAAITLGTSACSLTGNVASLQPYAPSDGQQVDLEFIKARNFIYLVSKNGKGYLVGSLINSSDEDAVIKVQYQNPVTSEYTDYVVPVAAMSKLDLGYNGNPPLEFPVVEKPGQTALVFVLESDTSSASMHVPVLDGALPEYSLLLEQLQSTN